MSTPGEKRETVSTAVWPGFSPAFLCPGKVCADRGHGADHTTLCTMPVPGSAGWRGSQKRHPQQAAGLLCVYGERVPLGAVGPECSSPGLEPRTPAEWGSLSVPLYLRQSLGHTHAHMYTHTHTHPSGSVCSWRWVLCVPRLSSHVSGTMHHKGYCDVAAGPEPLGGSLCTWPGLCWGHNPCEPLQRPEPGPPSHLQDRG